MRTMLTRAAFGVALGAVAVTATATPAEAQRYRHHRGHDDSGAVVVAGIAGIAIGAAIANSHDRRYEYDRRYYRRHGYYPNDGYYARHYHRRYDYRDCRVRRQWDPYLHRRVTIRYCR